MVYFLTLLACLFVGPLSAANFGDVEYHLPIEGWKIIKELKTTEGKDQTTATYYAPENDTGEKHEQLFATAISSEPYKEAGQTQLEEAFFFAKPTILEKDGRSTLLEWNMENKLYGLIRQFSTEQGTVTILYQRSKTDRWEEDRLTWIDAFKKAKLISKK